MRILVTGSSGVVGRFLCAELVRLGHQVEKYDLRQRTDRRGRRSGSPQDIRDVAAMNTAASHVDGVIHLAAVSRCAPAEADPALAESVNVEGTRTVIEATRSGSRRRWMIFASSREVYGEPASVPVAEVEPVNPKSVYGRSKAAGEQLVETAFGANGGRAMILRLTNLYGSPTDYGDRVIPAFVRAALNGSVLEVRGPHQILDILHVSDAVRAITTAAAKLESSSSGVQLLNVGRGKGISLRTLADQVVSCAKSRSMIREVAPVGWSPSRFVADIRRARAVLGWKPTIPLRSGLLALAKAYQMAPGPF